MFALNAYAIPLFSFFSPFPNHHYTLLLSFPKHHDEIVLVGYLMLTHPSIATPTLLEDSTKTLFGQLSLILIPTLISVWTRFDRTARFLLNMIPHCMSIPFDISDRHSNHDST